MKIINLSISILLFFSIIFAGIDISVTEGDQVTVTLQNRTLKKWSLGGWRLESNLDSLKSIEALPYFNVKNELNKTGYLNTVQASTSAPEWVTRIDAKSTNSFRYAGWGSGTGVMIDNPYILLKTGSAGAIGEPEDEPSILLSQIDSITQTSDYYNVNYRSVDSLGRYGGIYTGGFLDTWKGETQILFPYNNLSLDSISKIVANESNYMYWLTLAMGQEYFNVDMQWMMGFGIKETWSGTNIFRDAFASNMEGAYGPFEVEQTMAVDRAIAYYSFFPEYSELFASAIDYTSLVAGGFDPIKFVSEFMGKERFYLDSSEVVSGYLFSIINQFSIYNLFAYSEDFCWKEVINGVLDRKYGLYAIATAYYLGIYSSNLAEVTSTMTKDNWGSTNLNPNITSQFSYDVSNYNSSLKTTIINKIEPKSKEAFTNSSIEMWDFQITWDIIERFFLGESGSINLQGRGGLLKHFHTEDIDTRRKLMSTLEQAFNKLKGNAPGISNESISFRYDWLTLLRTIKHYIDNRAMYSKPAGGDVAIQIIRNSTIGGCSNEVKDTIYPFSEIVEKNIGEDITLEINAVDNKSIGEVTWTIDSSWNFWNKANYISGSNGDQNFKIIVARQYINEFYENDSVMNIWYMVTDESGNSIVKKEIIDNKVSLNQTMIPENLNLKIIQSESDLIIKFENNLKRELKVELFSLNGKKMKAYNMKNIGANLVSISKDRIASGVYLLKITNRNYQSIKNLIISH